MYFVSVAIPMLIPEIHYQTSSRDNVKFTALQSYAFSSNWENNTPHLTSYLIIITSISPILRFSAGISFHKHQ